MSGRGAIQLLPPFNILLQMVQKHQGRREGHTFGWTRGPLKMMRGHKYYRPKVQVVQNIWGACSPVPPCSYAPEYKFNRDIQLLKIIEYLVKHDPLV